MSIRKSTEKNIRKLTRAGKTSLSVTIPIEMIRQLKWREKQKVVIALKGETLTVKDFKP